MRVRSLSMQLNLCAPKEIVQAPTWFCMEANCMRTAPGIEVVLLLWVLLPGCGRPGIEHLGFTKGAEPVRFHPESDVAKSPNGNPWTSAESCRECHKEVYDNWRSSRHREAFTNQLYQESHAREPMQWCVNCHAPLTLPQKNADDPASRVLKEEGISCNVCHVRSGEMVAARIPQPEPGKQLVHRYKIIPEFSDAAMCESCHQFDFPEYRSTLPGQPVRFTGLPMQNTVEEWRSGGLSNISCQGCHVLSNSRDTHKFSGGHDLSRLSDVFRIEVKRTTPADARASIIMLGVGHNFPTGDLFRALRIRIYSEDRLIHEEVLKKDYRNLVGPEVHPDGPTKALTMDSTIPAPLAGDYASVRSFEFSLPARSRLLRVDLHMDYLHGANHLLTRMPKEKTQPMFKRVHLLIPERAPAAEHG